VHGASFLRSLLLVALCWDVVPPGSASLMNTCTGRCDMLEPGADCQCISWCVQLEDCCQDYFATCQPKTSSTTTAEMPVHEVTTEQVATEEPTTEAVTTITATTVTTTTTRTTVSTTTASTVTATTISSTTVSTVSTTSVTTVTATTATATSITRTSTETTRTATLTTPVPERAEVRPNTVKMGQLSVSAQECKIGLQTTEVQMKVRGAKRSFLLYLPPAVFSGKLPVWLVFHGTDGRASDFLKYSGLDTFAKQEHIALVVPQALPNAHFYGQSQFNVGLHSQSTSAQEDEGVHDVALVQAILRQVIKLPCIDVARIHCTGYSNGARFCMRLASELSGIIASVAPVAGLRYPMPNNASRPVPILAFHGDADPINPWSGNGMSYWASSVPDSMRRWAEFNHCRGAAWAPTFSWYRGGYGKAEYTGCRDHASVELIRLGGCGHQWPGTANPLPNLGKASRMDANTRIHKFFSKHRLPHSWPIAQKDYKAVIDVPSPPRASVVGCIPVILMIGSATLVFVLLTRSVWPLLPARRRSWAHERGPLLMPETTDETEPLASLAL